MCNTSETKGSQRIKRKKFKEALKRKKAKKKDEEMSE